MSVDIAVQWLFENPTFEPANTENIANTIGNMLGNGFNVNSNNKSSQNNPNDPLPPNNSPDHVSSNQTTNSNQKSDDFLYNLIENASNDINNGNLSSTSKSKRIYTHSQTLQSAATSSMDECKSNEFEFKHNEQQQRATTSTITSELSALSTTQNDAKQQYKDLKMVLVVRRDLKMSAGKMAAQCCLGCVGVVMDVINEQHMNQRNMREILRIWRRDGEKKIVLQCQSESELMGLRDKAVVHQLPHYLVVDAGHTQIPSGSKTVLAIGPYPSVDIDAVTKDLKLY